MVYAYMQTSDLWIHLVIYDTPTFNWMFLQTAPHTEQRALMVGSRDAMMLLAKGCIVGLFDSQRQKQTYGKA